MNHFPFSEHFEKLMDKGFLDLRSSFKMAM